MYIILLWHNKRTYTLNTLTRTLWAGLRSRNRNRNRSEPYSFGVSYTYTCSYMIVYRHVYDPELGPEPEPETKSDKMSEPEPSSNFRVPQPYLWVFYNFFNRPLSEASPKRRYSRYSVNGLLVLGQEVILTLRKRPYCSLALYLRLWEVYTEKNVLSNLFFTANECST
jgi:hypothetical protein